MGSHTNSKLCNHNFIIANFVIENFVIQEEGGGKRMMRGTEGGMRNYREGKEEGRE